jgi:hypothetical protein
MKRSLAALTLALLLALVVITVLGGVAFGAIVGSRFQAEDMTESSGSISVVPDPDGTGPAGPNLRWASGAGVAARASQTINVPEGSPVDQIQLFTRQASGGNAVFAIYVNGTAAANKVGTFSPPAGGLSVWGTRTVNLSPAIQPGTRTLYIGPNATFSNNAFIDWFELHNTGGGSDTTPPETTITAGPAEGSTDTDGNVSFSFSSNEERSTFQCSLVTQGAADSFSSCTSPKDYTLANGSYAFKVKATDQAGNTDPTPAARTFSVNITQQNPCDTATIVNPTSNLQSVIDVAGGNFCLRGGIYNEGDNQVAIRAQNVTVQNYPGERAEIRAQLRLEDNALNFRMIGTDVSPDVEGLVINNTYGLVTTGHSSDGLTHYNVQGNQLRADNFLFSNVEADGDNDVLTDTWFPENNPPPKPEQAGGVCFLVNEGGDGEPSSDGVFEFMDVHNCGFPPNEDLSDPNPGEHAFYLSEGLRTTIKHSQIYENGARSVQIRYQNDNALVYGNVIDQGLTNITLGDPGTTGNIVENNVVTRAARENINPRSPGPGNIVRNNCAYSPNIPTNGTVGGVQFSNNVNVSSLPHSDPEPDADAVVTNSTCLSKLPADSPFRP